MVHVLKISITIPLFLIALLIPVDGSYAITCGSDKKLKLWNPLTGVLLKTYAGHGDEVTDAAGSCDSCHIVSSSSDKSIIYWDVATGQPVRRLRQHAGGVTCVKFNEDSSVAVSGSRDNSVMCWDIRSRKLEPVQILKDSKDSITSVIVTDCKIITSSLDGSIRAYDLRMGEMVTDSIGGQSITDISLTKDGQCVVASCSDDTVRLIDTDSGDMLSEYRGHCTKDFLVECGVLSNDSQIICGSGDGNAFVWDLVSGNVLKKLNTGKVVNSLATHPSTQDVLFTSHRDIQLWGLAREETVYL